MVKGKVVGKGMGMAILGPGRLGLGRGRRGSREERLFHFQGPATTGKKSLGVSDLIDKDTRAQGRRMTLDG